MNPEQIATNIIADYQAQTGALPYAPNLLASLIAAALRAERERCAQIAENMAEEMPRAFDEARMMAFDIASALRAAPSAATLGGDVTNPVTNSESTPDSV